MLFIGSNKTETFLDTILDSQFPRTFLIVDDGTLSDRLDLSGRRKVTRLDFTRHCFNPFVQDYLRARQVVEILGNAWEGGNTTLTKETGLTFILDRLRKKPRKLAKLIPKPDKNSTTGHVWAHDKVNEILLSPVLYRVFNEQPNFDFAGTIIARIDRSLVRFDRFLLGNLLMSEYQGYIVVPNFEFYACAFHADMLERMTIGIRSFSQRRLADLRDDLLWMQKIPCRTTYEDAVELARWDCRHEQFTEGWHGFIKDCMR